MLLRDQGLKRRLSEYYRSIDQMEQWSGNWRQIQMDLERHLPEIRPRLEGMVRIQAMQFSHLSGVRTRGQETLAMVKAVSR